VRKSHIIHSDVSSHTADSMALIVCEIFSRCRHLSHHADEWFSQLRIACGAGKYYV